MRTKVAVITALAIVVCANTAFAESRWNEPYRPDRAHFLLGVRGFGGYVFHEGFARGGGGGTFFTGVAFAGDLWELELDVSGMFPRKGDPLGIADLTVRRVFPTKTHVAPHFLLGPVLWLGFGNGQNVSGGFVAGVGASYRVSDRVRLVSELAYRFLAGGEQFNVLTLSFGVSFRF